MGLFSGMLGPGGLNLEDLLARQQATMRDRLGDTNWASPPQFAEQPDMSGAGGAIGVVGQSLFGGGAGGGGRAAQPMQPPAMQPAPLPTEYSGGVRQDRPPGVAPDGLQYSQPDRAGLDKPPMPEEPRRGGILGTIGRALSNPNTPYRIAAVSAAMNGNHYQAAQIRAAMDERRSERRAAAAAAQQRQSYVNNLTKSAVQGGMGMSPGEAERVMADPESFARNYNERFGAWNAAGGSSIAFGGAGGAVDSWTAPETLRNGADTLRFDANTGEMQRFAGMTDAEQEARALGLQPGTPQFDTFIRDRLLDAQGPTGNQQHRERLGVTQRGQDMTDARGRRGQDMTDARSRRGQDIGSTNTRRGQAMTGNRRPTGRTASNQQTGERMIELQGGFWVPAQ